MLSTVSEGFNEKFSEFENKLSELDKNCGLANRGYDTIDKVGALVADGSTVEEFLNSESFSSLCELSKEPAQAVKYPKAIAMINYFSQLQQMLVEAREVERSYDENQREEFLNKWFFQQPVTVDYAATAVLAVYRYVFSLCNIRHYGNFDIRFCSALKISYSNAIPIWESKDPAIGIILTDWDGSGNFIVDIPNATETIMTLSVLQYVLGRRPLISIACGETLFSPKFRLEVKDLYCANFHLQSYFYAVKEVHKLTPKIIDKIKQQNSDLQACLQQLAEFMKVLTDQGGSFYYDWYGFKSFEEVQQAFLQIMQAIHEILGQIHASGDRSNEEANQTTVIHLYLYMMNHLIMAYGSFLSKRFLSLPTINYGEINCFLDSIMLPAWFSAYYREVYCYRTTPMNIEESFDAHYKLIQAPISWLAKNVRKEACEKYQKFITTMDNCLTEFVAMALKVGIEIDPEKLHLWSSVIGNKNAEMRAVAVAGPADIDDVREEGAVELQVMPVGAVYTPDPRHHALVALHEFCKKYPVEIAAAPAAAAETETHVAAATVVATPVAEWISDIDQDRFMDDFTRNSRQADAGSSSAGHVDEAGEPVAKSTSASALSKHSIFSSKAVTERTAVIDDSSKGRKRIAVMC